MNTSQLICSFCGVEPAHYRHAIDPRGTAPWEDELVAPWLACNECHALILAEDAVGLAHRAASLKPGYKGGTPDLQTLIVLQGQSTFWQLDTGIYEQFGFE